MIWIKASIVILTLAWVTDLRAQDLYESSRVKADSLRTVLECPADVDWPELPATGQRTFRTAQLDSAGLAAPVDSSALERPDVAIPQYAFFYRPTELRCDPVIVVQAEGRSLGWVSISDSSAGAAIDVFFDLLGTEPSR